MTAELGVFFLIVALFSATLQAMFLLPLPRLRPLVVPCLKSAAWLQALCITLAGATLILLRVDSDFSVLNVAQDSNLTLPLLYKIAGAWGNHEGSMLLWIWVLAMFGSALALREYFTASAIQATMGAGFLLFILCTSNPFLRIFPPPADGEALNPLLQDMGLAMHPPLLYLGYVGFGAVFSLAVAGLLQKNIDRRWAAVAHPWILAAWSALTLGIGLGSWWAYRVLGWGGFWFWDPVENVSLLPWLSGTALLHANMVLKKRGQLASWVALLSIVTFGLSMIGTFLVRSGVLTSVHSFASDPTRGLFILGYVTLIIGSALLLFSFRGGDESAGKTILPISREGMIVANNLFLLTACATVLLGTVYPMFAEWLAGERLSVGPPYFNATFLPLMLPPLLLAGLAPYMPWEKASLRLACKRALPACLAGLAAALLALAMAKTDVALAALGLGMATWLAAASVEWLKRGRAAFPGGLAHLGAAVLLAGITGMGLWQQQREGWLREGDSLDVAGYHVTYRKSSATDAPNYQGKRAIFDVTGNSTATLFPEYRTYNIRGTATSIAAVHHGLTGDLYLVIGETSTNGRTAVRAYVNPMIGLIWAGCVLMALGGLAAIILRRRRKYEF
ncbi:MAG: heme lyase CcmF/NrfE family subunit [Pseudomonadota bacterium]|nr:heme lyase CcmF/NrfE family subunit [Pseudomonadota bacterium]MDE3037654.1 heme lyase CcmF/NrfE family subunit [Pseudomonadota bacterium]